MEDRLSSLLNELDRPAERGRGQALTELERMPLSEELVFHLAAGSSMPVKIALIRARQLSRRVMELFATDPATPVRQALAERFDLLGYLWVQLMHDEAIEVRSAVLGMPAKKRLPATVYHLGIRDPAKAVRILASVGEELSGEDFRQVLRDPDWDVHHTFCRSLDQGSRAQKLPQEVAFLLLQGLDGRESVNTALVEEVRREAESGANGFNWEVTPTMPPHWPSPYRLNEIYAWKGANDESWFVSGVYSRPYRVAIVSGQVELPEAIDGLLMAEVDADSRRRKLQVYGLLRSQDSRLWGWEREGVLSLILPESLQRDLAISPPKTPVPAQLVGHTIAHNGLYALWEGTDGDLLGFTEEEMANKAPSRRLVGPRDLTPAYLQPVLQGFEVRIRMLAERGLTL